MADLLARALQYHLAVGAIEVGFDYVNLTALVGQEIYFARRSHAESVFWYFPVGYFERGFGRIIAIAA